MEIRLAKNIGFCRGVKRAVDMAREVSGEGVYILGQLIHNESVVSDIEKTGTKTVMSPEEVPEGKTVIIRSHGVHPDVYGRLEERGCRIIDCTCPFVKRTHSIVSEYSAKGYCIVIVGEPSHPEVKGIAGRAGDNVCITDGENFDYTLISQEKVCIVAQTTFSYEKFTRFLKEFDKNRFKTVEIFDTICYTTRERQNEAADLSEECDCMLVLGSKTSSNTNKLFNICSSRCKNVFLIDDGDLSAIKNLGSFKKLGIVSGASTPAEQAMEVFFSMEKNTEGEVVVNDVVEEVTAQEAAASIGEAAAPAEETVAEVAAPAENTAEEAVAPADEAAASEDAVVTSPQEAAGPEETAALEQEAAETKKAVASEEETPESDENEDDSKAVFTMEEAVAKMDDRRSKFRRGQKITATISSATDEGLAVYISNTKKEILLPKEEINCEAYDKAAYTAKVGEEIVVKIVGLNPVQLSEKAIARDLESEKLVAEIADGNKEFSITVEGFNKGGLIGHYAGYEVFVPSSQIRIGYVKDFDKYIGKTLRLKAEKVENGKRRQIVASQRVILEAEKAVKEAERAQKEEEFFAAVSVGDIIKGTAVRFANFGAFIEVAGIDCLAHISDLSWTGCSSPADVLEIGKEYEFKVLKCDKETKKVSLGYKQLQPRPWELVPGKYMVGDVVKGKVVRIVSFGAFVELEKGIDGLVHVSQISHEWLENPTSALKIGEEVEAKIIAIDHEKEKITLSIKAMTPAPAQAQKPRRDKENKEGDEEEDRHHRSRRPRNDEDDGGMREWKDPDDAGASGVSIAELLANNNENK